MTDTKYIQAVLSDDEYEQFRKMAESLGLKVKEAAKEAVVAWVQQRGKIFIRGVGEEIFAHPAFDEWHRFFISEYKPPKRQVLLFHNCTWGKPYHESWIFREMRKTVAEVLDENQVHFVVVSSSGVVPREYWDHWPFTSYDSDPWKFTPQDRRAFVRINSQRVANYLRKHSSAYRSIVAYFPIGDTARESVENGIDFSRCKLPYHLVLEIYPDEERRDEDYYACLTYPESLRQLKSALRRFHRKAKRRR